MKAASHVVGVVVLAATVGAFGCGRQAAEAPESDAGTQTADAPLPEWAPENPSPEFLRAARVLKPLPPELLRRAATEKGISESVFVGMVVPIWAAAYEFFGTLDDEQIGLLRDTGEVRLSPRSLAGEQREAMESFVNTRDEVLQADLRVTWFKQGAAEDLSNVEIGFDISARVVGVRWWVRNPRDPDHESTGGEYFATL